MRHEDDACRWLEETRRGNEDKGMDISLWQKCCSFIILLLLSKFGTHFLQLKLIELLA